MITFTSNVFYNYVKVSQNAILDPHLSLSDVGYLINCIFSSGNPNYPIKDKNYYLKNAEKKNQFKKLVRAGYVTEHAYPSSESKNKWDWFFDINSFNVRQDNKSIVYHRTDGTVSKYGTCANYDYVLPSDFVVKFPTEILLDHNLSLAAKGIYARVLSFNGLSMSKTEIMDACLSKRSSFNNAWAELTNSGYLTIIKKPSAKGMNYEFHLNLQPSNHKIIQLNSLGEMISSFIVSAKRDVENATDAKSCDKRKKSLNTNKRVTIKNISSKEESLKEVLNKFNKTFSTDKNHLLIESINKNLLKNYCFDTINNFELLRTYKKVLENFENFSEEVTNFEKYSNKIVRTSLSIYKMSADYKQNNFMIDELLSTPLKIVKKDKPFKNHLFKKYSHTSLSYNFDRTGLSQADCEDLDLICIGSFSYKLCPELVNHLLINNPNAIQIFEEFERLKKQNVDPFLQKEFSIA